MPQFDLTENRSEKGQALMSPAENSRHTASTALHLGSELSQSSGAYSLEGLTSSRAL